MILLLGGAMAAELLLLTPEGPPVAGRVERIEVVVEEGGRGLAQPPTLLAEKGQILGAPTSPSPGRYYYDYLAPTKAGPDKLRVRLGNQEQSFTLEVQALAPASPSPVPLEALVGTERLRLYFPKGKSSDPSSYLARVSEGKVLELGVEADQIWVEVQPDDRRNARILVVGLLSLENPDKTPVFSQARLRARQQASIGAEAGSSVTLRVGGRLFGPFTADSSGQAQVSFEIPPGTSAYEVAVADDLGNSQKVRASLPGPFPPALLALEAPRVEGGADLWLGAWTASGAAWTGDSPQCRVGPEQPQVLPALAPGLYRLNLPPTDPQDSRLDLRVECTLEEASAALRLPVGRPGPAKLDLRVHPEVLSTDFPVADVGVSLLDSRGERLVVEGVELRATHGTLRLEDPEAQLSTRTMLRAEYQGEAAVPSGGDLLEAFWFEPAGSGGAWRLLIRAQKTGEGLKVRLRVEDRLGHPLEGIPLQLEPEGGQVHQLRSGARGEVEADIPFCTLIRASAGELRAEHHPLEGESLPVAGAPELTARRELRIQAGRVRRIELDVSPVPLVIDSGQKALVRVRLLDASGQAVRDEPVDLSANEGTLGPQRLTADGTIEADYLPVPGGNSRMVELNARSGSSQATTSLSLVPRMVRGGVTLTGGYLSNFGVVSSPTLWATVDGRIPRLPLALHWRAGVGLWNLNSQFSSADSGGEVTASVNFFPVELGVELIQRRGRWQLQAGLATVVVPYVYSLSFDGEPGPSGPAIASPGLLVHAGAALRIGNSEIPLELRYLLFTANGDALSFDGSLGGLGLTAGYRILY